MSEIFDDVCWMMERAGLRSAGYTERVSRKVAKELLLRGMFFSHGVALKYTAKHVGCGVYEVKTENA